MDVDEYLYQRLDNLQSKINNKIIKALAGNLNVEPKLSALFDAVPLDWIKRSIPYTEDNDSLIRYSTEEGMDMLRKLHEGKELTKVEDKLLEDITAALYDDAMPRPDKEFVVFRGGNFPQLKKGDIVKNIGPSSATFTFQIAHDYIGPDNCCIAEIIISPYSKVTYLNMLDQVVFLPNTSFEVISDFYIKKWYNEDTRTYVDNTTIKLKLLDI